MSLGPATGSWSPWSRSPSCSPPASPRSSPRRTPGSATSASIYGAYFLAVCLATHIYLRIRLPNADPYLFPLVALLTAFGLVMIYRIDESLARDQANWFVLGLVLFALTIQFLRDYDVLERYRYTIAAVGLLLLLAPRLPGIGQQVNGAYLGVKIGPLAFQPAEFSKICIVVFLASYLREHREVLIVGARRVLGVTLPPLKHLGPLLVVWGASMFMLVFIRDLGSSLMFFAAFLALLYVATGRFSFVVIGMAMFLVGAWFFASTVPHVHDRVEIWLDPYHDPTGSGYQILQSIFAQADGGLFGKGFGQALITIPGTHDALLPAAQTDTIYSLIVNELGLFGACAVILIYLLIAARGFKIALLADDGFSKLLATGLTAVFAIQAFVIIGGVTRVIPLTGVTLPFISYGGSSIVANFVLLALLLLISDRARREAPAPRGAFALEGAMNRQIVKLFGFIVVLFAVLIGFTSYWSVFDAKALKDKEANKRPLLEQQQIKRGRILAADGTVLARSVPKGHGDGAALRAPLPGRVALRPPDRLQLRAPGRQRVRAVPQRRAGRRRIRIRLDPRPAARPQPGRQRHRHQHRPRSAAGRAGRPRGRRLRRRGRDRTEQRPGQGAGLEPALRPQPGPLRTRRS